MLLPINHKWMKASDGSVFQAEGSPALIMRMQITNALDHLEGENVRVTIERIVPGGTGVAKSLLEA